MIKAILLILLTNSFFYSIISGIEHNNPILSLFLILCGFAQILALVSLWKALTELEDERYARKFLIKLEYIERMKDLGY